MKAFAPALHVYAIAGYALFFAANVPALAIEPMSQAEETDDPPLNSAQLAKVSVLSEAELKQIDLALLANADKHWRKVARIVGTTMTEFPQRVQGIPDVFYAQRIQRLVAIGALESQGNLKRMRFSEVRLPVAR